MRHVRPHVLAVSNHVVLVVFFFGVVEHGVVRRVHGGAVERHRGVRIVQCVVVSALLSLSLSLSLSRIFDDELSFLQRGTRVCVQ